MSTDVARIKSASTFSMIAHAARLSGLDEVLGRSGSILFAPAREATTDFASEIRELSDDLGARSIGDVLGKLDKATERTSPYARHRPVLMTWAKQVFLDALQRKADAGAAPAAPPALAAPRVPARWARRMDDGLQPVRGPAGAPAGAPALLAWSEARGLRHLLDKRVREALNGRPGISFTGMIDLALEHSTILEVLTDELWASALAGRDANRLAAVKREAWAYLLDAEAHTARVAEFERELMARPAPEEPVARVLVEKLRALRVELRPEVPRLIDSAEPGLKVELLDAAEPLVERTGYDISRYRGVRTTIPLSIDPSRPLVASCDCGPGPCAHAIDLIDILLAQLWSKDTVETRDRIVRLVGQPAWRRALDRLTGVLASVKADDAQIALVWWLVDRSEAGDVRVRPLVQLEGKRGLKKPKRISLERLRDEHERALSETEADVLEMLLVAESAGRIVRSERQEAIVVRALRKLAAHPRVTFDADEPRPIRIEEGRLELVASAGERAIQLLPSLNGKTLQPAAFERVLMEEAFGQAIIELDPAAGRCRVTPLDRNVVRALAVLRNVPAEIPLSEREALIALLPALESKLPIRFEGAIARREVPAEDTIVLRLVPEGPLALDVAVLVRPLASGAPFPPGQGPEEIVVATDERDLVFARRDLAAEPTRARARLEGLVPGIARADRSWHVRVADGEAALELVARLRETRDLVVEWPNHDEWRLLRGATPADLRVRVEDRRDWFGLAGLLEIDGERVSLALLLQAVRGRRAFVQVEGGAWLAIGEALRAKIEAIEPMVVEGRAELEVPDVAVPELEALRDAGIEVETPIRWKQVLVRAERARALAPVVPRDLRAVLRPYQREGYEWLARLAAWGVGGCLADDMGLGKTVQALALLLDRRAEGPALVVAPTSVTHNWVREAERFAPGLRVVEYRGANRAGLLDGLAASDLVIASYGLLTRDQEAFERVRFATLVIDEAQAVKNAASRRAKAVRALSAGWKLALTGTPVENHLGELWSIFRCVSPGLLGSWEKFRERFALPIERDRDPGRARALARVVRPFILRRAKSEVAKELPPRTEIRVDVDLSARERALYEDARLAAAAELAGLDGAQSSEEQRFHVLAALTRLRQLACHPRLADERSKVDSAKLARLLELVRDLIDEGQRALIFSQFTTHLALVREALDREHIAYAYLDGSTPSAERPAIVESFQSGTLPLFLISLKAGGTGLNLTAADNVIHLDPWWNPAVEDQATDRAHRIGQTKPVSVYRLVTRGTIEEQILDLHAEKRALVAGVLEGATGSGAITTRELIDLIRTGFAGEVPIEADEEDGDAQVDVAPPIPTPPAATGDAQALAARFEAYRAALWDDIAQGRLTESSVRTYLRVGKRFLDLVENEHDYTLATDADRAITAYERRVEAGELPESDRPVAGVVLRRLCAPPAGG